MDYDKYQSLVDEALKYGGLSSSIALLEWAMRGAQGPQRAKKLASRLCVARRKAWAASGIGDSMYEDYISAHVHVRVTSFKDRVEYAVRHARIASGRDGEIVEALASLVK